MFQPPLGDVAFAVVSGSEQTLKVELKVPRESQPTFVSPLLPGTSHTFLMTLFAPRGAQGWKKTEAINICARLNIPNNFADLQ